MSDERTPLQRAIEVGVFAPVGLAVIVCDQLPRLVETGRARVEPRLNLARFIGQMAVTQGRREIERRLAATRSTDGAGGGTGSARSPSPVTSSSVDAATRGSDRSTTTGPAPAHAPPPPSPPPSPVPSVDELPIPAYDSLSAGQIVPLLETLDAHDLDLVERFESSHRHRRTILGRIGQLQETG